MCREEARALSERLTTLTIRMREVEMENMDLKRSRENFDRILERRDSEINMKDEELQTYVAKEDEQIIQQQKELQLYAAKEEDYVKTKNNLQIRVRQLEQKNVDLQTTNAAKDLDALSQTNEINRYLAQEEEKAAREEQRVKTHDDLHIQARQLEQANMDLQTANAAKDLEALSKKMRSFRTSQKKRRILLRKRNT